MDRRTFFLDEKRLLIVGMVVTVWMALGMGFYLIYTMPVRFVSQSLTSVFNFIQIIVTGLFAMVTGIALEALKRSSDKIQPPPPSGITEIPK